MPLQCLAECVDAEAVLDTGSDVSDVPPRPAIDAETDAETDTDAEAETDTDAEAETDAGGAQQGAGSMAKATVEWVLVLLGAVAIALLMRAFLFQAFWIPSESMETTLMTQDRVLVNKVSYRLHDINRGDVIVFARPEDQPGEIRDLIKRVIGLPGDTVEGSDNSVFINGQRLVEPYLTAEAFTSNFGPVEVPDGEVFVMGDNRSHSFDSRFFGPIPEHDVTGRAFALFWPLNRIGTL